MTDTLNAKLEQVIAQAFAGVVVKPMVTDVAEHLDGLVRDPVFGGKLHYTQSRKYGQFTLFKVKLGFKKVGTIQISDSREDVSWWTNNSQGMGVALDRDRAAEAVQDIAKTARKMRTGGTGFDGGRKSGISDIFNDTLSARRENDPALDAIIRALDVLKEFPAATNGFDYTVDCTVPHRTYITTTAGKIEVVKNGYVSQVHPSGMHYGIILRPTQGEMMKVAERLATTAHDLGQIAPKDQAANQPRATQGVQRLRGPQ